MTLAATANITDPALGAMLAAGLSGRAERVIVALNWTLVEGPDGLGLAHTPVRGTAGCTNLPSPGDYAGRPLASLATLWTSENVFERAIAGAAINAHWNRYDLAASERNGLDLIEDRGTETVVIGRFPNLETRLPNAAVVERHPGPNDYPEEALDTLLPKAAFVAVTASAVSNGSLPNILRLLGDAYTVMIGPSTPMSPHLLTVGIDALSGFIASDIEGVIRVVSEGGAVRALRPFGRFATITAADS